MLTECPTCSRVRTESSNPQGEARLDELASRNTSELDSASLEYVGVAMLPDWLKPAAIGEATFVCSRWAPRGGWRWRVRKEKSRNLRDPDRLRGRVRESDVLRVVRRQGNSRGGRGGGKGGGGGACGEATCHGLLRLHWYNKLRLLSPRANAIAETGTCTHAKLGNNLFWGVPPHRVRVGSGRVDVHSTII